MFVTHRRRIAGIALVLACGLPVLTGCGSAVQGAVEKAAGDAIGGNVDINSGGLSITDSNGNQVQIGEDVAMPDNWPAEVPKVEGGKLASVMVAGDGASVNALWTTDGATADAATAYNDALKAAGYTHENTTSAEGLESSQWYGNGFRVNVIVSGTDGQTSVMVNAEKAAAPSAS
jgi:hypothetical protein